MKLDCLMDKDIKMELKYCCKRGILVLQEMKDGGSFGKSRDETSSCCTNLYAISLPEHPLSFQSMISWPTKPPIILPRCWLHIQCRSCSHSIQLLSKTSDSPCSFSLSHWVSNVAFVTLLIILSLEERRREGKRNVKRHQLKSETRQRLPAHTKFHCLKSIAQF